MTTPQAVRRRRRASAVAQIPPKVLQWFEEGGEPRSMIAVTAYPFETLLTTWWREFASDHPGAQPPPRIAEMLADEAESGPPTEFRKEMLAAAKRAYRAWLKPK